MLTMNGARTASRQLSPSSDDITEASDMLTNPSYDIIAGDVGQFTTQYYHTVEPQEPTVLSPKDGDGSSSDSSTSDRSKSSSTSSDEGGHQRRRKREPDSPTGVQLSLPPSLEYALPAQPKTSVATQPGANDGSSVKHWSYEEQFKQVNCMCMVSNKPLSLCVCVNRQYLFQSVLCECVHENWKPLLNSLTQFS